MFPIPVWAKNQKNILLIECTMLLLLSRIIPHCIKHIPAVVLDVVSSTTTERAPIGFPVPTSSLAPVVLLTDPPINCLTGPYHPGAIKGSEMNSTSSCPDSFPGLAIAADPSTDLSSTEPPLHSTMTRSATIRLQRQLKAVTDEVEYAAKSGNPLNSADITALINSKLVSASTTSAVAATADESHFRAVMVQKVDGLVQRVDGLAVTSAQVKNIVLEVLQNQQLILDRLALIQQKAEAILVQNFELLEYTIPRLFIVLPETSTSWDPATMFRTKFRLHFICECGEHTKSTGSTIPHLLHLAKHE